MTIFAKNTKKHDFRRVQNSDSATTHIPGETRRIIYCLDTRHPPKRGVLGPPQNGGFLGVRTAEPGNAKMRISHSGFGGVKIAQFRTPEFGIHKFAYFADSVFHADSVMSQILCHVVFPESGIPKTLVCRRKMAHPDRHFSVIYFVDDMTSRDVIDRELIMRSS